MARTTKELTAIEIEKVKPGTKLKYLFDGKGLFLLVTPKYLELRGVFSKN